MYLLFKTRCLLPCKVFLVYLGSSSYLHKYLRLQIYPSNLVRPELIEHTTTSSTTTTMTSMIRRMLSAVARSVNSIHHGSSDSNACQEREPLPEPIPVEQLAETAHDQFQSYFFGKLPLEIRRQIYEEIWRTTSEDQHIFHHNGRLRRCACITDHDAEDDRDDIVENFRLEKALTNETYFSNTALHQQLSSTWTKHWKCEEHLTKHGAKEPSPFLSPLITCKRM